jgi:hypothetical protein
MFYAEPGPSHIIALDWRKTTPRVLQVRRSMSAVASHHLIVTVPTGCPQGRIVCACRLWCRWRGSSGAPGLVSRAPGHHRPGDPGHLVGQGDGNDLEWLLGQEASSPVSQDRSGLAGTRRAVQACRLSRSAGFSFTDASAPTWRPGCGWPPGPFSELL